MTVVSSALIGLSLSMDAFAISLGSSVAVRDLKPFYAVRAALFFGVFQFLMPVAGWYLGWAFAEYIRAFDHWVAFGLLAFIGGKMLWEARPRRRAAPGAAGTESAGTSAPVEKSEKAAVDIRSLPVLFTLAIATSIDALAVGLSFSILGESIWSPAAIIGCVTFAVCLTGFEFGRRLGSLLERWAGAAGGLVLIGIGVKILVEHLAGG